MGIQSPDPTDHLHTMWLTGGLLKLAALVGVATFVWWLLRLLLKRQVKFWLVFLMLTLIILLIWFVYTELTFHE